MSVPAFLNPFEVVAHIYWYVGVVGVLAALLLLIYSCFGRLVRSMLVVISVLICTQLWCTQLWWAPFYIVSRDVRFMLLLILCVRAVLFIRRSTPPEWETRAARSLVVAIAALAVASATWAVNMQYAFEHAVLFCLGLVVTFGLLWRMADRATVMDDFAQGSVIISTILFGAGFVLAGMLYAVPDWLPFEGHKFVDVAGGGRYSGVFYNPNAAGMIGTMILPMLVAAPRSSLGRIAGLRGLAIVLTATTIFLSGSRSALIGAALALCLIALYRFRAGAVVTLAFGVMVVGMLAFYNPADDIDSTAIGHITRTKRLSSLSGRLELWSSGWAEAQGHLAFGRGWGHSRLIGGEVDQERAMEVGSVIGGVNLHNAHLQLLIDVGIVGVILFWWFCLAVVGAGWSILRAPRTPDNVIGVVVFTSVLALLADTWVHGSIWSMGSPTTLAFWGMCALTLKQGARARRSMSAPDPASKEWTPPPVPSLSRA
jgi:O-antigen ligase